MAGTMEAMPVVAAEREMVAGALGGVAMVAAMVVAAKVAAVMVALVVARVREG